MTDVVKKERISASAVTNHILNIDIVKGKITNLHLNKILYFIDGFSLAINGVSIKNEDDGEFMQAWQYGPVIPSIYHEFKHYKSDAIPNETRSICAIETDTEGTKYYIPTLPSSSEVIKISDWVVNVLLKEDNKDEIMSAEDLVNITHVEGSPWYQVYKPNKKSIEIDNDRMKEYFIWYRDWLSNNRGLKYC